MNDLGEQSRSVSYHGENAKDKERGEGAAAEDQKRGRGPIVE
jgi:hypothetical protein